MVEIGSDSPGTGSVKPLREIFEFGLELCNLFLSYVSKLQFHVGQRNVNNLHNFKSRLSTKRVTENYQQMTAYAA